MNSRALYNVLVIGVALSFAHRLLNFHQNKIHFQSLEALILFCGCCKRCSFEYPSSLSGADVAPECLRVLVFLHELEA